MTIAPTINRAEIACPAWCTYVDHEDSNRPGGEAGARYDAEFTRGEQSGCFVHGGDVHEVGGFEVQLMSAATWHGEPLDGGTIVMLNGRELSQSDAAALAAALANSARIR